MMIKSVQILYNIIMLFVKINDSFAWESLKIIFNEMYLFIPPANTEKNHSEKDGGSNISNIF